MPFSGLRRGRREHHENLEKKTTVADPGICARLISPLYSGESESEREFTIRAANAAAKPVAPRGKRVAAQHTQQRCVIALQPPQRCVIAPPRRPRNNPSCPQAGFKGQLGQCNGDFRHYALRHSCPRAETHTMPTAFGEDNGIGSISARPERVCYVQNQAYLASRLGYIRPAILPVDNTASTGNTSAADDADASDNHRTFGYGGPIDQGVYSEASIRFGTPSEVAVL